MRGVEEAVAGINCRHRTTVAISFVWLRRPALELDAACCAPPRVALVAPFGDPAAVKFVETWLREPRVSLRRRSFAAVKSSAKRFHHSLHIGHFMRRRERVYERDEGRCFYCRLFLYINHSTADHFIPRLYGGTRAMYNSVLACRRCNHSKDHFDPRWLGIECWMHDIPALQHFREGIAAAGYERKHYAKFLTRRIYQGLSTPNDQAPWVQAVLLDGPTLQSPRGTAHAPCAKPPSAFPLRYP